MRIEQFEYLIDIANTKSITRTAENFFVSRQVVSANIRSLENELNIKILNRQQSGVSFTPSGMMALEKAQAVLTAYQDLLQSVARYTIDTTNKNNFSISIFAISRMLNSIISASLRSWKENYPHIAFRLFEINDSNEIINKIANNINSIGFIAYPDKKNNLGEPFQLADYPQLIIKPFIEAKFYILMKKNSKFSSKDSFSNEDLAALPLVSFQPALHTLSPFVPYSMNIVSSVNDLSTLFSFVKNDIGVGLITLQEYYALNAPSDFILKPIHSNETLYYAFVLHETLYANKSISELLNTLSNYSL